ncbi:MAG: helix-turn-helix domain-containing protein, partial [Prevotella sp.]|nr:helix-turn-helix domain-containing protein [Prevotella sp.]
GRVWVATFDGMGYFDDGRFVTLPTDGLPDPRVDRIHRDDAGNMWVRSYEHNKEVCRYDSVARRFITYPHSQLGDSLLRQAVSPLMRSFADPHSSRRWTVERHVLSQTDSLHPANSLVYTDKTAADAGLTDESIYCLLLDSRGTLWVGSATNGLFYANTHQYGYRRIVCRPSASSRAVLTDRHGALWLSIGFDGLRTVQPRSNHYDDVDYPLTDSVESRRVRTLMEDSNGALWMGTLGGLYMKAAGNDAFRLVGGKPLQVYALHEDEHRQLWIGAADGLYRMAVDKPAAKPQLVDSITRYILSLVEDQRGLWMASDNGVYHWADGRATLISPMRANMVSIDASGRLWVGTNSGLYRLSDDRQLEPVATPADGHAVQSLLSWRDFLWCSYNQGIYCINIYTGKCTLLSTKYNEYISTAAYCDQRAGRLYFCGTQGIDCFRADSLDAQLRTAPEMLWLSETTAELTPLPADDSAPRPWLYVALAILATAGCGAAAYYYRRRGRKGAAQAATDVQTDGDAQTATAAPLRQKHVRFVEQATAVVQAHIGDADWTAEQMAQEMAMSRSKLFTLMKEATGKGAMEFVRDIRLDYAAQLLRDDVPVAEVAYRCGFSDASSFRRSFAKKYGINPSQYRSRQ